MKILLSNIILQFPGMENPLLTIDEHVIEEGSRLLIKGQSGSGKTTLLHVLGGLQDPRQGTVSLNGSLIQALSENQRCRLRRESMSFVFQRLNILGHLTATENVQLGSPGRGITKKIAREALERVGLTRQGDQLAYHLSLGEQQRIAVARVLVHRPPLILADEPTSNLDEENANRVMDALMETVGQEGILITASHDDRIASRFSLQWSLQDGKIR